jgi:hypothetical protein
MQMMIHRPLRKRPLTLAKIAEGAVVIFHGFSPRQTRAAPQHAPNLLIANGIVFITENGAFSKEINPTAPKNTR